MKERPILFSTPMVRALLDGSKTQTRRIMRVQPDEGAEVVCDYIHPIKIDRHGEEQPGPKVFGAWWSDGEAALQCPFGGPGDRLWVRETHAIVPRTAYACSDGVQQTLRPDDEFEHDAAIYRAGWQRSTGGIRWRPSIFMPRWASRITLEITDVRVERVQEISEADAMAEGCSKNHNGYFWGGPHPVTSRKQMATATKAFCDVWESINGPDSWSANPWVWAIEFKRVQS